MADFDRLKLIELIALSSHGEHFRPLNLQGVDLSEINFTNLDLSGINFTKSILSNCIFKNNSFSDTAITNVTNSKFENVKFNKSYVGISENVKFTECEFIDCELPEPEFIANDTYKSCTFEKCWNSSERPKTFYSDKITENFRGCKLVDIHFDSIINFNFKVTKFHNCYIKKDLSNVIFENCNFADCYFDAVFRECEINHATIFDCKIDEFVMINCKIKDVFFENIKSVTKNAFNLIGGQVSGYFRLEACVLDEIKFENCTGTFDELDCGYNTFIINRDLILDNGFIQVYPQFYDYYELIPMSINYKKEVKEGFAVKKKGEAFQIYR